ncbi:MAG: 4Fe-4S binding protein [Deltaproteobacteria bacterium]|nr:4Fe-4S binding protein [Deltaproteobacteria bacterium]
MEQTPLSYPSFRDPFTGPTNTTKSRAQKIQALKRQVQAFKTELLSLERRTNTLAHDSSISGFKVSVDPDRCVGCGICQSVCPVGAISVENVALVDSGRCTGCRLCLDQCPRGALSIIPLKNLRGQESCADP